MTTYLHRIFLVSDNDKDPIVFVPTLHRAYRVPREKVDSIPRFVEANKALPQQSTPPDYKFTGSTLFLTNRCNLACIYCYGEFGLKKNMVMPLQIALATAEYILRCAVELKRFQANILLFGGEPTQAWDILKATVEYLRSRATVLGCRSRATITTNGLMETEQARWLAAQMDSVTVSMDGFKAIQDVQRNRSFDRVFATAREIYRLAPTKLMFRATVSAMSVSHLPDIVRFFGENFPCCAQAYEPLFKTGRAKKNAAATQPSTDLFFEKFLEALPVAHQYGARLKTSALNFSRKSGEAFCGVAARNFMVVYDGRVVACTRMASEDAEPVANLFSYGMYDKKNKFLCV